MKNKLLALIENKKNIIGILIFSLCVFSYSYTNHVTVNMQPRLLPLSIIDHAIPFFPMTVWIYLSVVMMCLAAFYVANDVRNITRYMLSLTMVTVIAILFYIFFPTIYPRTYFPIPTDIDHYTFGLLNWLRRVDCPTNCLPSLHVVYSFLSCFVFLQEQTSKFRIFLIWAGLITLSTMTTKQHYFLDVAVGMLFAYGMYCFFLYLIPPVENHTNCT